MNRIPAILDDALGFNLYRVALLFRRELMQALAEYELTPEQWQIMVALWSTDEPLSQNEIAELTLKDKHTVSRILGRLERDGWIERRTDPRDTRYLLVRPSAWAYERRERVPAVLNRHFDPILGSLEVDERAQLLRMLKRLRATLGDRVDASEATNTEPPSSA
jgi:MarR family transcriptional regulator, lower aerobic nicotinate degradation pathway regulator